MSDRRDLPDQHLLEEVVRKLDAHIAAELDQFLATHPQPRRKAARWILSDLITLRARAYFDNHEEPQALAWIDRMAAGAKRSVRVGPTGQSPDAAMNEWLDEPFDDDD